MQSPAVVMCRVAGPGPVGWSSGDNGGDNEAAVAIEHTCRECGERFEVATGFSHAVGAGTPSIATSSARTAAPSSG